MSTGKRGTRGDIAFGEASNGDWAFAVTTRTNQTQIWTNPQQTIDLAHVAGAAAGLLVLTVEEARAKFVAFAAALARDEVRGYTLGRLVPSSTDEDGHVDDYDYEPLFWPDEAPLSDTDPAYAAIVAAYEEWKGRLDA